MSLVYALLSTNAHQMLKVALLEMHQSSNGSGGLEFKQIVHQRNDKLL